MQLSSGQVIKGYQLGEIIGEGGFGAVYRAYQPVIEREVAIKVILPEFANQPQFIRRFEFEAQLIAQLEHPHIVPLYDYWREPSGAYLVMRVLGSNLRTALKSGAWEPLAVARLLDQVASALTVAHRRGVIHRDIKPDNILLDEQHNAYLADFGIAVSRETLSAEADGEGNLGAGSLGYITPEQIRGEASSSQSDLYSLGIVLYEMLTGKRPFEDDLNVTVLLDKHLNTPLPRLSLSNPAIPESLEQVIQRVTAKEPADRYPDAITLAEAFRAALNSASPIVGQPPPDAPLNLSVEPDNPYKGLRAFQESDAADFYGRSTLVRRLLNRLAEPDLQARFLAVTGPSGSGKSSVMRAGLIPALRRGLVPGSDNWFIIEMLPGSHPMESLETALLRVAATPSAVLASQLRTNERGLIDAVQRVLPADPSIELLLVIDQFEETFTLVDDEGERAQFLKCLSAAASDPNGRLRLIITLRADFMDRPLQYANFGELIRRCNEFVLPMTPAELEQTILRPAERAGVTVEPNLVNLILKDVADQPGTLPLLQYTLTELFERRSGRTLTLDSYRRSGGVMGSLARHAEDLYASLDEAQQISARQLFLRLVTPGDGTEDTRRRVRQTELTSLSSQRALIDSVIDLFSKHRLLTLDRDMATRSPTVEIAHEALIRTWRHLRDWLNSSREELRIQRRLMASAAEWLNAGRDTSFLASGARLDQFESWRLASSITLNQEEAEYLQASIAERDARREQDRLRLEREQATARLVATFQRATLALAVVGAFALLGIIIFSIQASKLAEQVNQSSALVATAQTQVAYIAQTLTPIPVTLTSVGKQVDDSRKTMEVLRLAAEANKLLLSNGGNVETAALLSIRALRTAYLPQADSTLREALERDFIENRYGPFQTAAYGVAFSPDGKLLAAGLADGSVHIQVVKTGEIVRIFTAHPGAVESVAFSPDGRLLATASKDTTARIWDLRSGRLLHTLGVRLTPVFQSGHVSPVNNINFSPDSRLVVTSSRDQTARVWDVQTGDLKQTLRHDAAIWSAAFSPDGKVLVTGVRDNQAILWDLATGQPIRTFNGHTSTVWSVAFAPDGKSIVTGSGDNTARIWDVQTGQVLRVLVGHVGVVNSVAYSSDGKTVLSGGDDASVRVWDVATGQSIRTLTGHAGPIWSIAISPDSNYALTGSDDRTIRLWSVKPDLSPYVFASHPAVVWRAIYSPDGRWVATGSDDGTAQLWEASTRKRVWTFDNANNPVYALSFSPDSKVLAVAGGDSVVRTWNVQSGTPLRTYETSASGNSLYTLAFSADGKLIASGGNDTTARIWDVQSGRILQTLTGHKEPITSVAFSPDSKTLITGSNDRTTRIWDVPSGQPMRTIEQLSLIGGVAFSPDGKTILTGGSDGIARIWNPQTGQIVRSFIGHSKAISSVDYSPDGKMILTGSVDTTARLWDAATGQEIRVLSGHSNAVYSVAFAPDGSHFLTSGADKTARVWETDYRAFVVAACARLTQDFTTEDRQRFNLPDPLPTCPEFAELSNRRIDGP